MRPIHARDRRVLRTFLSAAAAVLATWLVAYAQAAVAHAGSPPASATQGVWRTLPYTLPINPVHLALLNNGKILMVSGSGNDPNNQNLQAGLLDPQTGPVWVRDVAWDMFCNGMMMLPDGRVFINGGNLKYNPFAGLARSAIYDPAAETFTDIENMAHGRWYPTVTELGDARVMTFSGLDENSATNTAVEIYTIGSGWSPEYPAGWTPPLYPRLHLLPNGTVFYSASGPQSRLFNPSTHAWSPVLATTNFVGGTRLYGTSILLPLRPSNGYQPRVMIMGGGSPATPTTEIIDLSSPTPQWQYGPSMSQPRIEMSGTILPNGKVLALGGSGLDEDASTASLNADLYDPATNAFSSAGANAIPRLYHSDTILLPDARVLFMGGNPTPGNWEPRVEMYEPAYLFNADGSAAARPTITSVSPSPITYATSFQVQTPDAAAISQVVLLRPGAPTHAFDTEQRLIELPFTVGAGSLTVTGPPTNNIAPPGYYMLFLLNTAGVPSVAQFVQVLSTSASQRPTAIINGPSNDPILLAGGSVSFSGSGTTPAGTIAGYSWSFPGGTPASSASANPGPVAYRTPGVYVASLTVTNSDGLASQIAATRIVIVAPDFSVSTGPGSVSVLPGGSANYLVTVTGAPGFSGQVSFAANNLPAGVTASFNPPSITTSGSAVMTLTAASSTAVGIYPVTVAASSATNTHTAPTSLTVSNCVDSVALTYGLGTLNLAFRVGTAAPAAWSTWLVLQNVPYNLWSTSLPAVSPLAEFNVPIAPFPKMGTIYVITTLTPTSGPACWDIQTINTGS